MAGVIYLIQSDGQLMPMADTAYDSESLLQELLAKYPSLLAGDQIDVAEPRRWLLVSREMGIPAGEDGADRWSLDHLFLDQDGIPTLVEVKRSTDTRVRREVVGQMLDYAANAVVYWPVETIRARFEAECEAEGIESEQRITEALGIADVEHFWLNVKTNLQAGRIRMIFVADEIPSELRRIIEFLNKQTDRAEVLGVEIKQYAGSGLRALVPRVIGQTATTVTPPPRRHWDRESFLKELETRRGHAVSAIAEKVLDWASRRALRTNWGRGVLYGTFSLVLVYQSKSSSLFTVWTEGNIQVGFGYLQYRPPFGSETKRLELLQRLNSIPGVALPAESISKYPSFPLAALQGEAALQQFLHAFDWVIEEIKAHYADTISERV